MAGNHLNSPFIVKIFSIVLMAVIYDGAFLRNALRKPVVSIADEEFFHEFYPLNTGTQLKTPVRNETKLVCATIFGLFIMLSILRVLRPYINQILNVTPQG